MWCVWRAWGMVRCAGVCVLALSLMQLGWWAGGSGRGLTRAPGLPVEDRDMPLIFIGGVPRSGTTLMRAMLDAHRDVRCGQETRVIYEIISAIIPAMNSFENFLQYLEDGITVDMLENALAAFCLEVIVRHGEMAPRFCNKDPMLLSIGLCLNRLFPNAKFVFMVRDGRATVHSIIDKKLSITGFHHYSYRDNLKIWNQLTHMMYDQCQLMRQKCLMVHYERLVLEPRETMQRILDFLELPWDEAVLHHEKYINQTEGVAVSLLEWSSDQIVRAVYTDAVDKWVGHIPGEVRAEMADLAPMLALLGYNPWANPPRYANIAFAPRPHRIL